MQQLTRVYLWGMVAMWAFSVAAYAGEDFGKRIVREEDVIRALLPKGVTPSVTTPRQKGLRKQEDTEKARLSMELQFPMNSAKLTDIAKAQLDPVGRAMQSETLSSFRFGVVGHTCAKGTDKYNDRLSLRRAQTVTEYLVQTYAISPDRLRDEGHGERQLKNANNPFAEENRRVEIINLGQ